MTRTQRLALMAEGQRAYRAGKASTACPYSITAASEATVAKAAAWLRGYAVTRNIDTEAAGEPFYA